MAFAFVDELEIDRLGLVCLPDQNVVDSEFYCLRNSCPFHLDIISVDQIQLIFGRIITYFLDSELSRSDDFGLGTAIDLEDNLGRFVQNNGISITNVLGLRQFTSVFDREIAIYTQYSRDIIRLDKIGTDI